MSNVPVMRHRATLRIGSLRVEVDAPHDLYSRDFAEIFSTVLRRPNDELPAGLHVDVVEDPGSSPVVVPPDGLVITAEGTLHTEAIDALTMLEGDTPRARFTVHKVDLTDEERRIYLVVLLNKILFWIGYVRQHASAVALDGAASIFVGDRGAGKSSTCAYLAGRGALVLADDDVMIRRDGKAFTVSGCDETMRIMVDAERRLFGHLDAPALDFGGIPKKQITTADHFRIAPFADYPLKRIFFPRIGEAFVADRLPPSRVAMRLLHTMAPSNRFAGTLDHARALGYVTDLAARVPAYALTLTRDYGGLDRVFEHLARATD